MTVPTWAWIAIAAAAAVVLGVLLLWGAGAGWRRARLRRTYGRDEVDYVVKRTSSRAEAEDELRSRRERRTRLELRPLDASARCRYHTLWARAQEQFVLDPEAAVQEAERLIREVMTLRGYPAGDFEERAADLSLESPELAASYRRARRLARSGHDKTEELRKAFKLDRLLFFTLVGNGDRGEGRPDEPLTDAVADGAGGIEAEAVEETGGEVPRADDVRHEDVARAG